MTTCLALRQATRAASERRELLAFRAELITAFATARRIGLVLDVPATLKALAQAHGGLRVVDSELGVVDIWRGEDNWIRVDGTTVSELNAFNG